VRLTGLPQPTIWRLCYTLTKEGFLVSADDGRMKLGLPVLALGHLALTQHAFPEIALPFLQELTRRYRLGASLAVRDGLEMLYVQRTHGDFVHFNDPVGARRPFASVPTAWACYVAYESAERDEVSRALKSQDPGQWPKTRARLGAAADDFRRYGCIFSVGVLHPHFNAVAVPIRSSRTGRVYGLSLAGMSLDWPKKKLLPIGQELISLATELSLVAD
jgi:DNA-binding IclR family transcriptional regulator